MAQAPNVPYYSTPESVSPMGSPYSFQASPRTDSVDSPFSYGGVSYYQQSLSPDSVNVGSPIYHQVGGIIKKNSSLFSQTCDSFPRILGSMSRFLFENLLNVAIFF